MCFMVCSEDNYKYGEKAARKTWTCTAYCFSMLMSTVSLANQDPAYTLKPGLGDSRTHLRPGRPATRRKQNRS
jgi:hypothetical protein